MPKLKTLKSAKKRIRITKKGKAKHFKASRSHLLTSKRSKRKRLLGRPGYIFEGELKSIYKMLPYGA
ncbi:MAG: 50S ribosomal protein L35 [Candidatus Omnitrophica bacterium]|nr:50S ribosomal protein L35 [Candidatus Omnitrophota bacterium]MCM8791410.1 50S ribosomal protein L35 [Candidatus Omnitrophota bacterium]